MIDISQLPIATADDLQRVGQYLLSQPGAARDASIIYRIERTGTRKNGLRLAGQGGATHVMGDFGAVFDPPYYRPLTESQAIALAKTIPHVWPEWKATWPKGESIPAFADVRPGDSFEWLWVNGTWEQRTVEAIQGDRMMCLGGEFFANSRSWKQAVSSGRIRNYRRAEPATNIGALVAQKLADVAPEASTGERIADCMEKMKQETSTRLISEARERMIARRQDERNCEYAARMEQDKANILKQWRQPWNAGTNGMGSMSCVMRRR